MNLDPVPDPSYLEDIRSRGGEREPEPPEIPEGLVGVNGSGSTALWVLRQPAFEALTGILRACRCQGELGPGAVRAVLGQVSDASHKRRVKHLRLPVFGSSFHVEADHERGGYDWMAEEKTEFIGLRLRPTERRAIEAKARERGLSLSGFLRGVAMRESWEEFAKVAEGESTT